MGDRRMISRSVVDNDSLLRLAAETQLLYFHLNLNADDDGFCGSPQRLCRLVEAPNGLEELCEAGYLISFPSGVVVIRHWHVHNSVRKDSYRPTIFEAEMSQLTLSNGVYSLNENVAPPPTCDETGAESSPLCGGTSTDSLPTCDGTGAELLPPCGGSVSQLSKESISEGGNVFPPAKPDTQAELLEESLPDYSPPAKSKGKKFIPPTAEEVEAFCTDKGLNIDAARFVDYYSSIGWRVGKNQIQMRDWHAAARNWCRRTENGSGCSTQPTKPRPAASMVDEYEAAFAAGKLTF